MRYMRWNWNDLMNAPDELVTEIIEYIKEVGERLSDVAG